MTKEKQCNFKATREEFEAAKQAAQIERQTFSEFMRAIVRAELRAKGLWPPAGAAPAGGVKC